MQGEVGAERPDPTPGHGPPPLLPPGFVLGTTTAAYQVEGAASADGKGQSTWDTFTATPGAVIDGTSGERAADHYHRWAEDVALARGLGTRGYRFSISWPRIQPSGRGPANPRGLDFYDRLVDALLEAGLEPMATLHAWDLPQALEDDGGWLNRATVEAFADHAAVVGARLADRVAHWVPVDQPVVATVMGHGIGVHAPGRAMLLDALPAAHHLLVGHGRAALALRASVTGPVSVGCANNHAPVVAASRHAADVGAAKLLDALWNKAACEAVLLGRYPADLAPLLDPVVREGDLAVIGQPLDFYGVTYHRPLKAAAPADDDAELPFELRAFTGYERTAEGWPVVPEALRGWLEGMQRRFGPVLPPLVVTACGCTDDTAPGPDGVVDDTARITYLDRHLRAVAQAAAHGVDVRGFYVASLLDGFEWADGHTHRTGLVHVDPLTRDRTPKRSYGWYAAVAAAQPAGGPGGAGGAGGGPVTRPGGAPGGPQPPIP